MADRPDILTAKLNKLAEIVADGQSGKNAPPGQATAEEVRQAQSAAIEEVMGDNGSVAEVEAITLPTNRL